MSYADDLSRIMEISRTTMADAQAQIERLAPTETELIESLHKLIEAATETRRVAWAKTAEFVTSGGGIQRPIRDDPKRRIRLKTPPRRSN